MRSPADHIRSYIDGAGAFIKGAEIERAVPRTVSTRIDMTEAMRESFRQEEAAKTASAEPGHALEASAANLDRMRKGRPYRLTQTSPLV